MSCFFPHANHVRLLTYISSTQTLTCVHLEVTINSPGEYAAAGAACKFDAFRLNADAHGRAHPLAVTRCAIPLRLNLRIIDTPLRSARITSGPIRKGPDKRKAGA
jgi:hypothetical protein